MVVRGLLVGQNRCEHYSYAVYIKVASTRGPITSQAPPERGGL